MELVEHPPEGEVMAKILLALAAMVLAGGDFSVPPAMPEQTPHIASTNEIASAYAAYILCLQSAASRLDDGRSDPIAMAPAIEAACKPQFEATLNMFGPNVNLADAESIKARERATQSRLVIVVITGLRTKNRK